MSSGDTSEERSSRSETIVGFPPLATPDATDPVHAGPLSDEVVAALRSLARPMGVAGAVDDHDRASEWSRHVELHRSEGVVTASYWWRTVSMGHPDHAQLRRELRPIAERADVETFRFELTEMQASDPMVLFRFDHGDRRRPQMDLSGDRSRRKLTLLVPLTGTDDRQGGDLVLPSVAVPADERPGHLTVMPSWVDWGVSPITQGSYALAVCWAHGPPFR